MPTIRNSMDWACLSAHDAGVILRLRVSPNAARTQPAGLADDPEGGSRLHLRLKAPPVEGKANRAACAWAAEAFGVRASHVSLLRGDKSRRKDLLIEGIAPQEAAQVLDRLLGPDSAGL